MTAEESDSYRSLVDGPEVEVKILASRFIGQAFRVTSEGDARSHLLALRKHYHDARHHCSAWRIGPPPHPLERSDDDAEPSASAGPPILDAIRRAQLFDAAVVVTRYFGGTKLGRGGLVRAYDEAARSALDAAPPLLVWCDATLAFTVPWSDVGAVESVLARFGDAIATIDRNFGDEARFSVRVRRSRHTLLAAALTEGTAGRSRLDP